MTDTLEAKAKDQGHKCMCSQKKILQKFFSDDLQKKGSSKIFFRRSKKNNLENNFSADLQNFNHLKNSAVLEPRTGQFSRTWGFEAKDFKMCPWGQGRFQGLHLGWRFALHMDQVILFFSLRFNSELFKAFYSFESFLNCISFGASYVRKKKQI